MTIWRMRIAGWIPKARNTHSEYVIIIAFPLFIWYHGATLALDFICCVHLQEVQLRSPFKSKT
jgi:hypothetical protein